MDAIKNFVLAVIAKVRAWFTTATAVVIALLSAGELLSGHISTMLGPDLGPKVAAGVMLLGAMYNVYQRVKNATPKE